MTSVCGSSPLKKDRSSGVDAADIVFVLDVTGSMGDEIDGVKNHIVEFADSLSYRGIDFRLGMVTFLDVIENVYPFTRDVSSFSRAGWRAVCPRWRRHTGKFAGCTYGSDAIPISAGG